MLFSGHTVFLTLLTFHAFVGGLVKLIFSVGGSILAKIFICLYVWFVRVLSIVLFFGFHKVLFG